MSASIRDTPSETLAKVKVIAAGYGTPREVVDALVSSAKAVAAVELQPTIVKAIEEGIARALAAEGAAIGQRVETLTAGWLALRELERHLVERAGFPVIDPSACAPCMRFGVAVSLRGAKPSEVLHLRCEDAQRWQRQVEAANQLVFGEEGQS